MQWQKSKVIDSTGIYLGESAHQWESEYGYRVTVCSILGENIYTLWCPVDGDTFESPYYSLEAAQLRAERHFFRVNAAATPAVEGAYCG